jgi:pilus assembly protein CpaF
MEDKKQVSVTREYFGPLYPYIEDDEITDVDFDGKRLWVTDCSNHRYVVEGEHLGREFVEEFTKRVANTVSKPFHKQSPVLEAETDTLRITIVHESVALSGRAICIRKSPPFVRLTLEKMLQEGYCDQRTHDLIRDCVKAKMNLIFCGEPGVGKTECAKYFSQFIPEDQRVITIEDNPEWHYDQIAPGSDCVSLRISPVMDYTKAIKTCLRLNPKWMMVSEVRSKEVCYLMEGFSTGVRGMTTLHTDDIRKIPDRIINMAGSQISPERMENDVYSFIDCGILIRQGMRKDADGCMKLRRYIDQVGFFSREQGENSCCLIVDRGEWTGEEVPEYVQVKAGAQKTFEIYQDIAAPFAMVAEEKVEYKADCKTVDLDDMEKEFIRKTKEGVTYLGKGRESVIG